MTGITTRLSRDKRKTTLLAAGIAALSVLAWLAIGQTVAGFTATTENTGNTFEAGTVVISDDDAGVALFTVSDLLPGHNKTETITVINESSAPLKVKLFSANVVSTPAGTTTNIADNLDVVIRILDNDTDPTVFSGTLTELGNAIDWSTGQSAAADGDPIAASDQAPGGTDEVRYEISVTLRTTAGNEAEDVWPGDSVTVDFIWEGRA